MVTSLGSPIGGFHPYMVSDREYCLIKALMPYISEERFRTLSVGRLMCLAVKAQTAHVARVGQHEDGTWWVQEITSVPAEVHEHEVYPHFENLPENIRRRVAIMLPAEDGFTDKRIGRRITRQVFWVYLAEEMQR